eukprot:NODE_13_length_54415_cov_0.522424.p51 type:complete len:116 gc:universal NODE_13_length_54415_cov_0.522424:50376-50029(-)
MPSSNPFPRISLIFGCSQLDISFNRNSEFELTFFNKFVSFNLLKQCNPTAQARGLPPKVVPWSPTSIILDIWEFTKVAPIGNPFLRKCKFTLVALQWSKYRAVCHNVVCKTTFQS